MSLITIDMPVYNGDKFLNQALESLSKQTFADYKPMNFCSNNAKLKKIINILKG